ncbi:hypothetical protein [Halopenitus persicus]|uniref:Uncharacterized protein n=1 Tax=Halopenitus persicus TaxID=1048396 RepID=A0A1H3MS47_9EURY|nr:hypothetical protein [Halopenitus persicus]SDY79238.1 hypothetical protein SAMN05216564_11055 [Halopenitus persicus]
MTRTRTRIDAVAFTLLLVAALSAAPVAGAALGVDAGDRVPTSRTAAGSTGSSVGTADAVAIDAADVSEPAAIEPVGVPEPAAVEANNTYRGSNLSFALDGTTLEVSVSADAFEGNDTSVTVTVADAEYENVEGEEENGTYTYDVDLTDRSFGDLSDATVTVERGADGEPLGDGEGDLRYVALTSDGAQFDDQHRLVVPIEESVGLEGDLPFSLEAGDQSADVNATLIESEGGDEPDRLRFDRSSDFETLIGTGEDVEIGAADAADAPRVGSPVTVSPSGIAGDPRVSLASGEITVLHPLIVSGNEYVVTIEGTIGDRSPTTTRRLTAETGGEVRFSAENLVLGAPGSNATVTIEGDGGTIGSDTVSVDDRVLDASVDANTSTVTVDGLGDALGVSGTDGGSNESARNGSDASSQAVDVYVSWEHNGSREFVLVEDVPTDVENGKLAFPEAGYELTGSGHDLLIVTEENATAAASIGGSVSADTGVEPVTGVVGGGVGLIGTATSFFLGSTLGQIIIGFLVVVVIGGIGVFKLTGSSDSNGSGGRGRAGSAGGGNSMMRVSVDLVDANGDPVDTTRTVVFEPSGRMANAMNPQKKQIAGSGEVQIPAQQYYVSVDGSDTGTTLPRGQESIRIQVPPQQGTITVHSARDEDQRIVDAEIRCRTPEDVITTDVNGDELRTDRDGTTTLELPPSVDADSVTLEVEHDRYESAETGLQRSIGLEPKTGTLTVETSIDGRAAGNVPVSVRPTGEFPRANDGGTETRSDEDGEVTIDDLVIGEYRVTASFTSDAIVDVDEKSVEVVPDEPRRVSIDGSFDFDLAPYRSRIDELNEEIADLTRSNRDGAIQYYYGSVLTATLDLLSEFPDQGLLFVEHGVDPDEVTEAVLSAVADAIEYTRDAMTTKQNVDLFGACSSLRNERIRWEGDPSVLEDGDRGAGDGSEDRRGRADRRSGRGSGRRSERGSDRRPSGRAGRGDDQRTEMLEELIAVVAAERADHRGRTADRLEETEAFLSERRGEVSTVSPVREQYDRIKDHLSSNPGETRTEKRVQFVVATWMLDAVRRVFDHPALVDRLEETVF